MDPFTFGLVFVGATGGALIGVSLLDKSGIAINGSLVSFVMEVVKYGGILYLLKELSRIFL
ncbi:malate:quinone oxidoreductase [Heyndrickxia sp. FSL W8-0496]|uniref:Malate:quinone oxidoreductase n=1 Tax=Heyndrickxia oleronia TaxID=38875 RepID=A0AAW6SXF2_9BACI|nr:malate:quinone oxidoreductase [Heyndrickxia oleronia]MBU5212211.1 malate:quinone oxidoreductase [Heyndrickxia oleronia]MDH5161527.1 malate:quinone oxidoreductase [Heyndrickxia oleronia]